MFTSFSCRALGVALFCCLSSLAAVEASAQEPLMTPVPAPAPQVELWQQAQEAADPSISRTSYGTLNVDALAAVGAGTAPLPAVFQLSVFGEQRLVEFSARDRCYRHVLLRGSVGRGEGDRVVLALGVDGDAAALVEVAGTRYELRSTGFGGVHALHQLDAAAPHGHSEFCGTGEDHAIHTPADGPQPLASSAGATPVDVCIFYTPAVTGIAGGKGSIEASLAMRLAVATQSSEDSGVNQKYTLVHAAETNYTETGTGTDLSRFQNRSDGYMDEVHGLRNTYGGDLMALITSFSSQFCGVAYLMTNPSTGFRDWAFSVNVLGCLGNDVLAHEMGHNMGCSHDRQNGGPGAYPYSYGYRSTNNAHRTIMAYSPGSRISMWSGPNVVYSGFTMGTANDDNVRSLNNVSPVVSNFTPKVVFDWELMGGGALGWLFGPIISFTGAKNHLIPIRVRIDRPRPGAPGVIIIGNTTSNIPLFGATLIPNVVVTVPVTGSNEGVLLNLPQLAALPSGTDTYYQGFFVDSYAPSGLSATAGMRVTVP